MTTPPASPQPSPQPTGPLSGVLVVDLSRALAGPHATMMLGDLGARIVKVEAPGRGDDTRGWGPPFVDPADGARESTYFLSANRNKESICLDLKDNADREVLLGLVERADVLVENFRTGVLDRLGLGFDHLTELNPRLVILSITGFGHDGPEGGRAGYDQIAQGEAGLMSVTGSGPDDPQRVGVPISDLLSGMNGAFGVVTALYERERAGRGRVERDVDEARPGDVGTGHDGRLGQPLGDVGGQLARIRTDPLGEPHRDVRGPVAVVPVAWPVEHEVGVGHGDLTAPVARIERGADGGGERGLQVSGHSGPVYGRRTRLVTAAAPAPPRPRVRTRTPWP